MLRSQCKCYKWKNSHIICDTNDTQQPELGTKVFDVTQLYQVTYSIKTSQKSANGKYPVLPTSNTEMFLRWWPTNAAVNHYKKSSWLIVDQLTQKNFVSHTVKRLSAIIMAALHSRCGHYIFALWFLPSCFLAYSQRSQSRCLPYLYT